MKWVLWVLCAALPAWAGKIEINAVQMQDAPVWLDSLRVQRVVDHVEDFLEWSIRRVRVSWYEDAKKFGRVHGFGPTVRAVAIKDRNEIHLGPQVGRSNFDQVMAHELTHIVVGQKYKKAIPRWLEEGLANHVAQRWNMVDYRWLNRQKLPDYQQMGHPFNKSKIGARLHYAASTALMEMIAANCEVNDLLQLSVGKKLETYLRTYCEIKNVNQMLDGWVKKKALAFEAPAKPSVTPPKKRLKGKPKKKPAQPTALLESPPKRPGPITW